MQNAHLNPLNDIDNFKSHQFTPELGHTRMYHGHQTKIEPIQNFQTTQSFSEQDFRRFELTTTSKPLPIQQNHDYASNGRRIINNQNDYVSDGRRIISDQNDFGLDGHRNFGDNMCTRKPKCNDCLSKLCKTNQCTRGQSQSCNSCLTPQPCNSCLQLPLPPALSTHDLCSCKTTCPPVPSPVCPVCPSHSYGSSEPTSFCAKRRAQGDAQDTNKNTQYNYYDLFPNIGLRSGDENQQKSVDNSENEDNLQYKAKESEINNQVKEIADNLQTSLHQPQDSHDIFYSSERKRRGFEDQMTFKPFWQMDEYNYKRPSELKSLRYTTLQDRRYKKSRWTTTSMRLPTESITIKLDDELIHKGPHRDHITEKYLSFEELMHLRKLTTLESLDYEARRFGEEILRNKPAGTAKKTAVTTKKAAGTTKKAAVTTKKAAATTSKAAATTKHAATTTKKGETTTKEATKKPQAVAVATTTEAVEMPSITANTPFIRMKQCTRQITCTWTALMFMTGSDGNPLTGVPNGAGGVIYNVEVGSRTPPGYVEGCTRTSTCTRDFMDRNIMPVQEGESEGGAAGAGGAGDGEDSANDSSRPEDEEYCERKSFNVQRRNLDETDTILSIEFQKALTEMSPSIPEIIHVTSRDVVDTTEVPQFKQSDCICYEDNSRIKRDEVSKYEQLMQKDNMIENKNTKNQDTEDDLYNMLRKMSIASKLDKTSHRCACNCTKSIYDTLFWAILLITSLHLTYV